MSFQTGGNIFHIIYIIKIPLSPAWHNDSISSGFDEGRPALN